MDESQRNSGCHTLLFRVLLQIRGALIMALIATVSLSHPALSGSSANSIDDIRFATPKELLSHPALSGSSAN